LPIRVDKISVPESRSGDSDTLMYAIDLDDNQGFVLIAGPADMSPLLAVIESGSYNDPENTNNSGYQYYISETKSAIAKSIDGTRIPITPQPMPYWTVDSINYKYKPIINLCWGQGWPENQFSPNKIAGCVPLATAMIMAVLEQPKTMSYNFSNKDISSETIDWVSLKKHASSTFAHDPSDKYISEHLSYCQSSSDNHKTLARIIRQIGEICNANYTGIDNTNVIDSQAFNGIKGYLRGIDSKESSTSRALFSDLSKYQIALVYSSGHAWVADGIWRIGMKKYYYEPIGSLEIPKPGEIVGEYKLVKTEGNIDELIHFNWGRCGNCNGWFNRLSTYATGDSYQYDSPDGNIPFGMFDNNLTYMCVGKR